MTTYRSITCKEVLIFIKSITHDEAIIKSVNSRLESPYYLEIVGNEEIVFVNNGHIPSIDDIDLDVNWIDLLFALHKMGRLNSKVLSEVILHIDNIYFYLLKNE